MDADSKATRRVLRLTGSVQNYDWGRTGADSLVANLYGLNSGQRIDSDKAYAEFWMGTHESGPSFVAKKGGGAVENGSAANGGESVSLKSWILKNPNVLGDKVLDRWGCDLPFLFKVLSVAKALSIQAHPDKELAKTLHKLLPNLYKDDNHKPEMALAITEFEALCSFISLQELNSVLQDVPEIVELVGSEEANQVLNIKMQDGEESAKSILRSIFTHLMMASNKMTTKAISKLKSRLHKESQVRPLTEKEQLVLRLEKQYPADIGVIAAFFFNYVKLNPGQALYLGANELHAYISGECIECMATSDNVVRAGLTPKLRDVQTLCSMLTYKQGFPEILIGFPLSPYITRYLPPFDEFEIDCCILPNGASSVFPAVAGPSIFLVTVGEGTMLSGSHKDAVAKGDVLFAPAYTEVSITTSSEMQLYRAGSLVRKKLFVHFVLDPISISDSATEASFAARYGCLVLIENVERLDVGALVSIRGVGRVKIVKFFQADPYLKGEVIPMQDTTSASSGNIISEVSAVKDAVYSLNSLEIKLKAPKEAVMQTNILNSLQWADKEPSFDCDETFIPSLPERVSFAAFQPVSGSTQSELLKLKQEKLKAMDSRDTKQRLNISLEFVNENISMLAAKLAIQSLEMQ